MEHLLIEHCAPTLAGIKIAGLFTAPIDGEFAQHLKKANEDLNKKDVYLEVLRRGRKRALIYVYRKKGLEKQLNRPNVHQYLSSYGYTRGSVSAYLDHLKRRIFVEEHFPHEIGIFLGYPMEDVIGFIDNMGQNFKCNGFWKVYGNVCQTKKIFDRYSKCTRIYKNLFEKGKSVLQLTVAA